MTSSRWDLFNARIRQSLTQGGEPMEGNRHPANMSLPVVSFNGV